MSSDPVIIAGAGIGGLTAALALLRRGIDVAVYEQADELGEIGAGVQISANGTRVLHALGLEAALRACAVEAQSKEVRHWKTGAPGSCSTLAPCRSGRYGAPYYFIHRGDLHAVLAEAVRREKADAIRLDAPASVWSRTTGRSRCTWPADERRRATADRRRRGALGGARRRVRGRPAAVHGLHGLARGDPRPAPAAAAFPWPAPTGWAPAGTSCTTRCGAARC